MTHDKQSTMIQRMLQEMNSDPEFSSALFPLFLFLWLFKKNELQLKQDELSELTGFKKRTVRSQLYKLRDAGYINYDNSWGYDGKKIELQKFRHDSNGQTTT